jgi:Collagen triple helix repeat (20 copies)
MLVARLRSAMTYANVVSTVCLVVVLGGTSYAALELPRNSVRARHIAPGAVGGSEVRNGSLQRADFGRGQIAPDVVGVPGPAGRLGPSGALGALGPRGPEGSRGGDGAKGADGTDGVNGVDAIAQTGAVMFFNLASCPAGWFEYTNARGRYLVGVRPGGALGTFVGAALENVEERAVGEHTHGVSQSAHVHGPSTDWGFAGAATEGTTRRPIFDFKPDDGGNPQVNITAGGTASFTIANAGIISGTPAPYLQLLVCQKL